jgi:hypothetical protein
MDLSNVGSSIGLPPIGLPPIGTGTGTGTGLPPVPPSALDAADKFSSVSGLVGSALGGGIATLKSIGNLKLIGQGMRGTEVPSSKPGEDPTTVGGGIGSKIKGFGMGAKALGGSAITGAKYGAIVSGAVSALSNGYQVLTGKKTGADAVGSLAADTVVGTMSGAGGAVTGGIAALSLSALGLGSLPVTIIAAGLGLAGAAGIHLLTTKTGLYDSIKNSVGGMLGAPKPTT